MLSNELLLGMPELDQLREGWGSHSPKCTMGSQKHRAPSHLGFPENPHLIQLALQVTNSSWLYPQGVFLPKMELNSFWTRKNMILKEMEPVSVMKCINRKHQRQHFHICPPGQSEFTTHPVNHVGNNSTEALYKIDNRLENRLDHSGT